MTTTSLTKSIVSLPPSLVPHLTPLGKTNDGTKLFGRSIRHKDVRLCCIGGTALYLAYRFHVTKEFEKFQHEDWFENKKWFDIKILINGCKRDPVLDQEIKNKTYSEMVESVLRYLRIPSCHWVHIGRVVGPKILEFLEEHAEEIRRLGNWNPSIQETAYSTKIPMKPMRMMAGFDTANGMYYNPRTTVEPPQELLDLTPFAFAFEACPLVEEAVAGTSKSYTALTVLRFLKDIATVFLQDAAAMWILHPDRREHPMYSMPIFSHGLYEVSRKRDRSPRLTFPKYSQLCIVRSSTLSAKNNNNNNCLNPQQGLPRTRPTRVATQRGQQPL